MNLTAAEIAQAAPRTVAAVVGRQIGPRAVAQPSGARVRLSITKSEARKAGVLDRWQAAHERHEQKAQRRATAAVELHLSVLKLLQHAEAQEWSQRELARRAGLSWGAFRRCRDGQIDPTTWLPKLHAALSKLNPS